MSTSPSPTRLTWLVIWGAMTLAPILYYVVAAQFAGSMPVVPRLAEIRLALGGIALAQLAAGGYLLTRAPRARAGTPGLAAFVGSERLATPQAFQTCFVIAAGFVEACAVLGFALVFLGTPLGDCALLGAASMAVMLAIGLPTGLRYWRERKAEDAGGPPAVG